ncbi:MAG: YicC family protein [Ruminiclostridium sp.]|nr:YicC family protein [Ruminiclostridium sp.]
MIRSMTGFGREQTVINGREIIAEIKSVNHKFFEFSSKLHRSFGYLEPRLKTLVKEKVTRGKIELSLSVYNIDVKDTTVRVNENIAAGYIEAIRKAAPALGISDDISTKDIFRIPDAFTVIKEEDDEEALWADISSVVNKALDKFVEMREREGEALKADVLEKAQNIENMVNEVEKYSPESTEIYRNKLFDKMKELLGAANVDEQRILLEAAIFSEKIAVDEETVRLHSHMQQLRQMLEGDKEIGRKLDFLIQEINRETNTIGSKANDLRITRLVVDMKSEIEKMREQVQNIE